MNENDTPPSYVVEHSTAFLKLCRLRIEQLKISFESVDEICGFPLRYTAKIMSEEKGLTGFTMFTLARGLALLPTFVHDATQLALLQKHSAWRPLEYTRKKRMTHTFTAHTLSPDFKRIRAIRANLIRTQKVSPKRRSQSARTAALARWSRVRSGSSPNH
jgi:hypothetical protein